MLSVSITSLKEGVHDVELHPEADALALDPAVFRSITVAARLDRRGDRIMVTLEASALATLTCDRTLKLFDQPLEGTHHVLFAPPEIADGDEDVRVLLPADQEIDLTEPARDTLLLALPARCLAPGAEDEEIPVRFGEPTGDDAIDPRWEALRKLRS